MACAGLHCSGCVGGSAAPPLALTVLLGATWVAEHIIEVAITSAACGALAVAAVVALMRWADRRDARLAARGPLLITRGAPRPALTATVIPQVIQGTPPSAVTNNYYIRIDPADREAARIIRTALPGMAGDITEGK